MLGAQNVVLVVLVGAGGTTQGAGGCGGSKRGAGARNKSVVGAGGRNKVPGLETRVWWVLGAQNEVPVGVVARNEVGLEAWLGVETRCWGSKTGLGVYKWGKNGCWGWKRGAGGSWWV